MKPNLIYVLYGSDRFTRDEQVRGLKRRMLSEPFGEYNLSELSGKEFGLRELRAVADALPFMADRRLVIADGLFGRLSGTSRPTQRRGRTSRVKAAASDGARGGDGDALEGVLAYLGEVPATTALVFVEEKLDPRLLAGRIPSDRAHVRAYERPKPSELGRWIERRVKHHRGRMEAAAIRQLAQLAPEDLGLLDNEILKLVTYADDRPVTLADVELLSATPDITIFGLLDSIATGQRGKALGHLRALLQRGERPEMIVPQLAATFRRLLQARELLDQGHRGQAVWSRLGVHPFVAEKTERQARGYRIDQIENAMRRLLKTDWAIKTGEAEPELALELFIADLPRAQA